MAFIESIKKALFSPHAAKRASAPGLREKLLRADLAKAVIASGLPSDIQAALCGAEDLGISSAADIPQRLANAGKMLDLCVAANMRTAAPSYVSRNVDIEDARHHLIAALAEQDDLLEINTSQPEMGARRRAAFGSDEAVSAIYKRRAEELMQHESKTAD